MDLLDSLISLYRTKIRSRKWYNRLIHMLDLTVAEAWLLYCRDSQECRVPKKEQLSLLEFKCEAAACLCAEKKIQKRKGRPSSDVEEKHAEKQAKRACSPIALYISLTDNTGHWPVFAEARGRCTNPGCKGLIKCTVSEVQCKWCKSVPLFLCRK